MLINTFYCVDEGGVYIEKGEDNPECLVEVIPM